MKIQDLMDKYSLYGSIVTAWKWGENHKLILEVDLSNLNQHGYSEDQQDFKPLILVLNYCEIIDELNEGFDGFSHGDARIIEASESKKEGSTTLTKQAMKLVMMYDAYDGTEEKLISVVFFTDNVSVIYPNNP